MSAQEIMRQTRIQADQRLLLSLAAIAAAALVAALFAGNARASVAPEKLLFEGYFGREVNLTEVEKKGGPALEDVCLPGSGAKCQAGRESSIGGGYDLVGSVAGGLGEEVYVADTLNHRVQELTSTGQFVLMFGRQVNQTETVAKAGPALEDVCTAASGNACQAGAESTEAGGIGRPVGMAVDAEGDVYVAEWDYSNPGGGGTQFGERVQKFTGQGGFLLEIGKGVNGTTHGNVCTREEEEKSGVQCVATAQRPFGAQFEWGGEAGAFNFDFEHQGEVLLGEQGNILGVGGPEDLLYVGDEGRVQEFRPDGAPAGEIALTPAGADVHALAVEATSGNVYFVYGQKKTTVQRLDAKGQSVGAPIEVGAGGGGASVRLRGLAVDQAGRLAVVGERVFAVGLEPFGELYEAATGLLMTTFRVPGAGVTGIAFDGTGTHLFAIAIEAPPGNGNEIFEYKAVPVAELTTGPVGCAPGPDGSEGDATFDCALEGEVNTEGVSETEIWFEWGVTEALGESTPKQPVGASGPLSSLVLVRPNTPLYYRLAGEDANVLAPEQLIGQTRTGVTPLVAPRVLGAPAASFVTPSSAVLSGDLNPENAQTEYFFEYAAGESALLGCPGVRVEPEQCQGVSVTPAGHSSVYSQAPAILQAAGLQPGTTYAYRLAAESGNGTETKTARGEGAQVGSFTTATAPTPRARTGPAGGVTAGGATISGVVEPDGAPATYSFELGIYAGAETQYGIVFSGSAGSTTTERSLALTGLQPGTTYAYRIAVTSGYIANATHTLAGETAIFTTSGLAAVLETPQSLPILRTTIAFPVRTPACRRGFVRDKHGKCVKSKSKRRKTKKARRTIRRSLHGRRK
jgi:hypothetical protein